MEHIVQFAIAIDDKTIQKRLEANAYDDIINNLTEDCKKSIQSRVGYPSEPNWGVIIKQSVYKFVESNHDEIVDAAAKLLKESYCRTKAYKEKMKEIMDEA